MISSAIEAERANLYAMIGDLLCEVPNERTIAGMITALDADRAPPRLATARAMLLRALKIAQDADLAEEHRALFRSADTPLRLLAPCTLTPSTRVAHTARPVQDRIRHLLNMAMQADRCAHAASERNLPEAISAYDAGRFLITSHGGDCLFDFALRLEASRKPFFSALGAALRELVERDLARERTKEEAARRWLALSVQRIMRPDGRTEVQSLVPCPQQCGEMVSLDSCMECGRWDGMQFGGPERKTMILCRVDGP